MMIEIAIVREVTTETEVVATIGEEIGIDRIIITKNLVSHCLEMLRKWVQ